MSIKKEQQSLAIFTAGFLIFVGLLFIGFNKQIKQSEPQTCPEIKTSIEHCLKYNNSDILFPPEKDVITWNEWVKRQGNPPSGSFEILHTGGADAIRDVRFFVITDVMKGKDCLIGFWKNEARPFGLDCN